MPERLPVLPEKSSGNRVVNSTKLPDWVIGPCFQSILMIIEVPETRCSHPGECVRYGNLSDWLPKQVRELPDNCYPIPDSRYPKKNRYLTNH